MNCQTKARRAREVAAESSPWAATCSNDETIARTRQRRQFLAKIDSD